MLALRAAHAGRPFLAGAVILAVCAAVAGAAPGPADPSTVKGAYFPATGNVFVSANQVLNWVMQAADGSAIFNTDALTLPPISGGLNTADPTVIGVGVFAPPGQTFTDWNLGEIAPLELPENSLYITYEAQFGSPSVRVPVELHAGLPFATLSGYIATRTSNSVVHQIDLTTGVQAPLGPSGVANIRALEYFNGILYAAADDGLYSIDTTTGIGTPIGPTGVVIDDLAVGPNGVMYGNAAAGDEQQLLRINVATGQTTPVGTLAPYIATSGLAIDDQGRALGWDEGAEWLFDVNLQTGAPTSVGALGGYAYQALDFDGDGLLYGWTGSEVRRINPTTLTSAAVRSFAVPAQSFTLVSNPDPFWNKLGPGTFAFDDAANWTPSGVPSAARNGYFALDGDVDVVLGEASAIQTVRFTRGVVRLSGDPEAAAPGRLTVAEEFVVNDQIGTSLADGARVRLGSNGPVDVQVAERVLVGQAGYGDLTVGGSALASLSAAAVEVGSGPLAEGRVVVNEAGQLTVRGDGVQPALRVGVDGGVGELRVLGGSLATSGSALATHVGVGPGSTGTLAFEGLVGTTHLGDLRLGAGAEATGVLALDLNLGEVTVDDFHAGVGGAASVSITRTATLRTRDAAPAQALLAVADDQGVVGQADVEVAMGGVWEVDDAVLGVDGSAQLRVSGGEVRARGTLILGEHEGGRGAIDLQPMDGDGMSQLDVVADLIVGDRGFGELRVAGQASAAIAQRLVVGRDVANRAANRVTVAQEAASLQTQDMLVGDAGRGELSIEDGAQIETMTLTFGEQSTGDGRATVMNANTSLLARDIVVGNLGFGALEITQQAVVTPDMALWIGRGGVGELQVSEGARLYGTLVSMGETVGSRGAAAVADAVWSNALMEIGGQGEATLDIGPGGSVTTVDGANVAAYPGARGVATLRGAPAAPAQWTVANLLQVGPDDPAGAAQAELAVHAHAQLEVYDLLRVGQGGRVLVDGGQVAVANYAELNGDAQIVLAAGQFAVGGPLVVGAGSRVVVDGGTLTLQDLQRAAGSAFEFVSGEVAFGPPRGSERVVDEAALAAVLGPGARLGAGQTLRFDDPIALAGALDLEGGTLAVPAFQWQPGENVLDTLLWDRGTLAITGSDLVVDVAGPFGARIDLTGRQTLDVSGALIAQGSLNAIGGYARFGNPSVVATDGQLNAINATLQFDAGLSVEGDLNLIDATILGDVQVAGGLLRLAGTNAFGSDVQFGAADELALELQAATPGAYDRLEVAGDAVLGGSLTVRARDGFALAPGETLEIVSIGGAASGQFAGLPEGALVDVLEGTRLFITYQGGDGNDVALFTGQGNADLNGDGHVDGLDLQAWEAAWGTPEGDGDASADGVTDGLDLLAWQRAFGLSASAAVGEAVPEPGPGVGLLIAALSAAACRRLARNAARGVKVRCC